eukprot:g3672.t1
MLGPVCSRKVIAQCRGNERGLRASLPNVQPMEATDRKKRELPKQLRPSWQFAAEQIQAKYGTQSYTHWVNQQVAQGKFEPMWWQTKNRNLNNPTTL